MFDLIATVLAWFYKLVPNYAAAIALLTLTVMILLTPLTLKGTKSMLQMQRLQPEMKRIQQQYKGDRQQLNEELMKFYKENKINPLGGCLPLLLQTPVFIVLFRVLRKLTETCNAADVAKGACTKVGNFKPSYISHSSRLWQDLTGTDKMLSFGVDLSKSAVRQIQDSFGKGIPYLVMILIVAATSFYQQRQITARNTSGTPVNPQQAMLMKIMPLFLAVISLPLPAGVVVYFIVSNLYRILQQAYITRTLWRTHGPGSAPAAGDDDSQPSSPRAPKPTPKVDRSGGRPTRRAESASEGNGSKPAAKNAKPAAGAKPRPAPTKPPARPAPRSTGGRVTPPGANKPKRKG